MSQERNYDLFTFKSNSNQNRTLIPNNLSQNSITCWNCSFFFKCDNSQPVVPCPNCNKYNRVPKGPIINTIIDTPKIYNDDNKNINDRYKIYDDNNNININKNYNFPNFNDKLDKILICPFCNTKNLFERNADDLICYKCSQKIKSENNNDLSEILTERESFDKKIIGWRLVPNPQYIEHPLTPLHQNSNTEYLLKKILKSIKKQNNRELNPAPTPVYNPYIPYPVFDYRRNIHISSDYDDRYGSGRTREIRYIPIRTETEKEKNDGYKITIRKKNGKNGLAKSTVFEKVFYINK